MAQMNIKTKFNLSLSDMAELKELLEKIQKAIPEKAEGIVREVSKVGLENNYKSTQMMSVKREGNKIIGGIETKDRGETFAEFGTGIVGSGNPHVDKWLAESGWKYDVNGHGEKGWIFPIGDGNFRWTKGMPAQKKFYEATKRMKQAFPEIAKKILEE